ncbi:Lsr2 family protein [Pseudonocardia zijingensis]|jgi:hypothetical protein|uniref:Lsr2 protein n=1 Tax=Pseudonocardia zijingensis TaxID=153376 RepID=A0ABP4AFS7_9PSEU
MAEKIAVRWVDDLTGEEVPDTEIQTVQFGLDGAEYEIDLGPENAQRLRSTLAEFAAAARRARSRRTSRTARSRTAPAPRSTESTGARAWLKANGYEVAERGRIPQHLLDVWRQHKDNPQSDDAQEDPEAGELDTSDAAVLAWHEAKGYKVPASGKVNGLMRHRYLKEHGAA